MMSESNQTWKEVLQEDYHNIKKPPQSKDENWKKTIAKISNQKQKEKPFIASKTIMAAACVMIMAIGSIFITSTQTQAFDWFVNIFETSEGDTTQISQTMTDSEGTSPQMVPSFDEFSQGEVEKYSKEMTFNEAQEQTDFYIAQPSYLPESYHLDVVTVQFEDSISNKVSISYEGKEGKIMLEQTYQSEEFANAKIIDNEDTKIKTVQLAGGEARLLEYKNGSTQIIWSTPQLN